MSVPRQGKYPLLALALLTASASPAHAQNGDFPTPGDDAALVAWLGERTNIVPGTVVSVTPGIVVALVGKTEPTTPTGPMRLTLRQEVISAGHVDIVGGRSSLMSLQLHCEERRLRMDERHLYAGANLSGSADIVPASTAWVRIPESSVMDDVARAACEADYNWPLKTVVASAAPPPAVPAAAPPPIVLAMLPEPIPAKTEELPQAAPPAKIPEPLAAPAEVTPEVVVEAEKAAPAPPVETALAIPLGSYQAEAPPVKVEEPQTPVVVEAASAPPVAQPEITPEAPTPDLKEPEPSAAPVEAAFAIPQGNYQVETPALAKTEEPEAPVVTEAPEAPSVAEVAPAIAPSEVKLAEDSAKAALVREELMTVKPAAPASLAIPMGAYQVSQEPGVTSKETTLMIQIGAYRNEEIAVAAWRALSTDQPALVEGLSFDMRPVTTPDGRHLVRGLVGEFVSAGEQAAFCKALAGSRFGCIPRSLTK